MELWSPCLFINNVARDHGGSMPLVSGGVKYYRTTEAARSVGISRSTLLRWLSQNRVEVPVRRDRNGWRVFTVEDISVIRQAAEHIEEKSE